MRRKWVKPNAEDERRGEPAGQQDMIERERIDETARRHRNEPSTRREALSNVDDSAFVAGNAKSPLRFGNLVDRGSNRGGPHRAPG